jgi:hypothetical protein
MLLLWTQRRPQRGQCEPQGDLVLGLMDEAATLVW